MQTRYLWTCCLLAGCAQQLSSSSAPPQSGDGGDLDASQRDGEFGLDATSAFDTGSADAAAADAKPTDAGTPGCDAGNADAGCNCADGSVCVSGTCKLGCFEDSVCADAGLVCNTTACLPPPGCFDPCGNMSDAGCATVCYGYCE